MSCVFGHWSVLVDFSVVLSCTVLILPAFRKMSQILWIGAMVIVAVAGTVGFFHSFRNSGDSMPLPFEWLNEYWASVIPLLMFSSLCTLLNQMDGKSDEIVEIRNNPSVQ